MPDKRPVPLDFEVETVLAASRPEDRLFHEFHSSAEPQASLDRQGLTMRIDPSSPTHMNDDDSHYYNTTGSAAAFWKDAGLPRPEKDIRRLRADFDRWGFCLVGEALSADQLAAIRQRVNDQAAGERAAGVGLWLNASASGSNTQFVTTLLNKGECFEGCLEFDPDAMQAGPLIEQFLSEALGGAFLVNSFQAIIAHRAGYPQALHQDGNRAWGFQRPEAPLVVTAMYMLDDVGPENGGTLVIPGSHRILADAGSGMPVGDLPPPINVAAPAGTVMLFDGRLLHGTGVNHTEAPRHILIAGYIREFMRTQEVWHISASPDVLARASPQLRKRLGFTAPTIGTIEGHGLGATGAAEDDFSSILAFREAYDRGDYVRVGVLSRASGEAELRQPFTYRQTASGRRSVDKAGKMGLLSADALEAATLQAFPGGRGPGRGYAVRGTGNNELHSKL